MRRAWIGVVAGLLAATLLVGVALTAYHVGRNHEVTTEVVSNGEVVHVVGGHWGYGPGPGFFLFPVLLLTVVLVVLVVRGRHPGGPWGYRGYGPWSPGGPSPALDDWHRRAHQTEGASTGTGEQ
jgi:hypothetical protein